MAWTALCRFDELTEGQGKFVQIDGFALAVFMDDGKVFAMDNACPHAGGPLADGAVEDGCCVCPWHGWAFNLETGGLRDVPGVAITTYKTRLLPREGEADLVQADIPLL